MHIHSLLRPIAGVVQLPLQVVTDIHYALHFTRSLPQMNTFSSEWVKHVARTFIGPEYPNLKLFDFHYFQPCLRMETFWPLWSYNLTSFNNYGNFVRHTVLFSCLIFSPPISLQTFILISIIWIAQGRIINVIETAISEQHKEELCKKATLHILGIVHLHIIMPLLYQLYPSNTIIRPVGTPTNNNDLRNLIIVLVSLLSNEWGFTP